MIRIKSNRDYAILVLSITGVCLLYYSFWVIGLPFVSENYFPLASRLFPPIHLAFVIPLGLGCLLSLLLFCKTFYLVSQDRIHETARAGKQEIFKRD